MCMSGHNYWRSLRSSWPPLVLANLSVALTVVFLSPLNHDAAWVFIVAKRLVRGDQLYVDVLDPNPPLVFWLLEPFAYLQQLVPASDAFLVGLSVAVPLFIATYAAAAVLNTKESPSWPRILSGFLLPFALLAGGKVGQRDPMAALLLYPYVLLAARYLQRAKSSLFVRTICGVLAGFGVALKPYFLLPWLVVELLVLIRTWQVRSVLRLEAIIVILMQCTYLLLVMVAAPEYLSTVVPLALATYAAYDRDLMMLIHTQRVLGLFLLGCAAVFVPFWSRPCSDRSLAYVLGGALLGFLASYLFQMKGWSYQLVPALLFGSATSVTLLDAFWRQRGFGSTSTAPHVLRPIVMTLSGLTLLLALWCLIAVARFAPDTVSIIREGQPLLVRQMADFVHGRASGRPIFVMSTSVWPAFPVVNLSSADWPYRFNFLWPLPGFHSDEPQGEFELREPAERAFLGMVVSDLTNRPPRILIVAPTIGNQGMEDKSIDFLEYFSESEAFRVLMADYRRTATFQGWKVFERTKND